MYTISLHNNKTQLSTTQQCPNLNPVATAKTSEEKWYVECSIVGGKAHKNGIFRLAKGERVLSASQLKYFGKTKKTSKGSKKKKGCNCKH